MRLEGLSGLRVPAVAVAALATAMATVVLTPSQADAGARTTATGQRCTIVGSNGRDVLKGTPGRDVICGRGGNDVIDGRGGNDVLDGGAGNDSMSGAGGKDSLYGGPGRDSLDGGAGDDRLLGGRDNDRLRGSSGKDVLSGGAGNETIAGGSGDDRISGGDGADTLTGEDGNDVVAGDGGDDDLSGGPGGDAVDGGPGFNVCDVPGAGDSQLRCAIDTSKPAVGDITVSPSVVDVSSAPQLIQVRAHVTDDTGVKSVQIGTNLATLLSGTTRDGTWATTIRVPRFIVPGPHDLDLFVRDRVGRDNWVTKTGAYNVLNTVYDKEMPVLQSLSLSASSLDVRTAAKNISATVRVTDDLAGPTSLYLCPAHAMPTGAPSFRQSDGCMMMTKLSGTAVDSTWKGTLTIAAGAPSGTWNVEVWISDAAGNLPNDFWFGPDAFAALGTTSEPRYKAIPNGAGAFTVLGSTPDANPPVLTSLTMTPTTVDTSHGAVLVTADVAGTDVEGITGAALFISGYAGYPDNTSWTDLVQIAWVQEFQLISGTPQNGVWRAAFVVPGGTPNGTYFIQAAVKDSAHMESWVSSDSGWTTDSHVLTDALAPNGTHFVVANSG